MYLPIWLVELGWTWFKVIYSFSQQGWPLMLKSGLSKKVTKWGLEAGIPQKRRRHPEGVFWCDKSCTCQWEQTSKLSPFLWLSSSLIFIILPTNLGLFTTCWNDVLPGLTDLEKVLLQVKEKNESLFSGIAAAHGTASTRCIPHH